MCLRRSMHAEDQVRLLAAIAGAKSYEPPADRLAAFFGDLAAGPGGGGRYARILAVADAAGGEVS